MKTEFLSFPTGMRDLNAYFARPSGEGRFLGLIVIHEVAGLNNNIRKITERFAEAGYASLAVDLFTGLGPVGRAIPVCMARYFFNQFFRSFNHGGIHDLKAALAYLATRPEVDEARLGAIGSCMGGGYAIAWACIDPRLRVIAPFYGYNPRPLEAVRLACPVVGSCPANDEIFTHYSACRLDKELDQGNIPHDIKIYPDTKHSFCNDSLPSYDAAACEDAFRRTLEFFA